ncbi:MAG: hypothetical protein A2Y15_02060 [Clostridiales bacterium GWF2_36_10]|nr:MAG: hypothetical protein A2Y15_02060 [Clostridiales bacterium GWF2_36_10]HAN21692.1 hypothetical protein [Clostridiales bacterium]
MLILLLLFALMSSVVASCNTTPNESSAETNSTESTTSDTELFGNLPDVTYGDAEITILVEGDHRGLYQSVEIMQNETSPELINSAVALRNTLVEEKFKVKIVEIRTAAGEAMNQLIMNNQTGGTDLYDIVMPYIPDAAALALQDYFYKLNDNENLHLDQPYWDQRSIKGLSINEENYFITGDFSLLSLACTHAIVFNKDLVTENNLENPIDLVKDGEWTLDKMAEMARKVTSDSNGTAGMQYNDTYGFLVNGNFPTSMVVASGESLTGKDANDLPILTIDTERAANVFSKVFGIINDKQVSGRIESFQSEVQALNKTVWQAATEAVANKKALFRAMAVADIPELGDFECNFGILPIPKYDEEQTEYYSLISTIYATSAAIPVTNSQEDFNRAAVILDAICQASTDTVKQNYYEVMLKLRKIQDDESAEMLDLIFGNRVYDLGIIFGWGSANLYDPNSLANFMNTVAFSGTNTFTSTLESIKTAVQADIDETVEIFQTD